MCVVCCWVLNLCLSICVNLNNKVQNITYFLFPSPIFTQSEDSYGTFVLCKQWRMLVIQDDMYPDYLFCIAWQRQLASVNTQYTTAWQLQLDLLIVELLFTSYFSSFSLFILLWSSVWNFHNLVRVILRFWTIF